VFMRPDENTISEVKNLFEQKVQAQGLTLSGWREVPTDSSACGEEALILLTDSEFFNLAAGLRLVSPAFR